MVSAKASPPESSNSQLQAIQIGIHATLRNQIIVGALLCNAILGEYHEFVARF